MDPYTRARTVRIGKWRWPPPKEEGAEAGAGDQPAEGFFEFKMRKMQQKMGQTKDDDFDTSGEIQSWCLARSLPAPFLKFCTTFNPRQH